MKLGYNEIMIASMCFNDIIDFINLEIGIKRFQGNMERFHFNPIPLNHYSRKLFTNIETFHIYNERDRVFNDGRIFKYVIWYKVDYLTYLEEKGQWDIYKNIIYTYKNREIFGAIIPLEAKSLGHECFYECYDVQEITIPSSVSEIGYSCFNGCTSLTSIIIPPSIREFKVNCFCECCSLKSINIPSSASKLDNKCFSGCSSLTSITIPSSIKDIGTDCFSGCSSLKSINIPSSITKLGDECLSGCISLTSMNIDNLQFISEERIFINEPVLISIKIPKPIQMINGKELKERH
ncbi:hypothetical protein, conserved [Entamoeba dispar SAW760]|uniref:Leucine rich repeat containing protein BspA family protein n=1 Tax=Entamoeba dispar (strain ATCC PRA-260 / SAW760) TaxID=370354 RepID=B0EGL4_ENTDS|nr:uncharacterized protein EDI_318260 [Entamoeba dispar SAW760]EDR26332.1 hypothetical protein, conserved [Entamoeba dispar SAW760]|eukprot:EDR26332.1 hypothetical protein, conserved [Entamoeba dispar SAW760]